MKMRKWLCAAVAAVSCLGLGSLVKADTITIHDISQDVVNGIFVYSVSLDAAADVRANDGFVIYDFAGETSYTITGGLSTSQFTLTQPASGNTLTQNLSVHAIAQVTALTNGITFDSAAVPNLNFSYVGPPATFLGATTATLTVRTSVRGNTAKSVDGTIDHSGTASPFGFSSNPLFVPAAGQLPLPSTSVAGMGLIGLLGAARLYRTRKQMA